MSGFDRTGSEAMAWDAYAAALIGYGVGVERAAETADKMLAARRLRTNEWTSYLGRLHDIESKARALAYTGGRDPAFDRCVIELREAVES